MATTTTRRKTTEEQGVGWKHRQRREGMLRRHQDGAPCDECGEPMYKDPTKNWDYVPDSPNPINGVLQADHSEISRAEAIRRGVPIPLPDRLLHGECNRRRGDGRQPTTVQVSEPERLLMPWPWAS